MKVMKNFKVGDWCFCEFELQQIKEMEGDQVRSVTTGNFCMSGTSLNDRCFNITMPVKLASDSAEYWNKKLHAIHRLNLNYPDIHRKLVSMWVDICEETNSESNRGSLYKKLNEFAQSIINRAEELKYESVDGVKLFRN